jgi:hypothetical protein
MLRMYIWKCICLSSRASWLAINGLVGSALGGAVMTWQGAIQFFNENSGSLAKGANILISTIVYAIPAFTTLFVLHACFISPFFVWKVEREARMDAESKLNKRENRKNIRITLGEFLAGGRSLMAQCHKENIPPPIDETNQWNGNVEGYLANMLDTSYVERFHTATGIMLTSVGPSSETHKQVWRALFIRRYRLQEFIKELSHG